MGPAIGRETDAMAGGGRRADGGRFRDAATLGRVGSVYGAVADRVSISGPTPYSKVDRGAGGAEPVALLCPLAVAV